MYPRERLLCPRTVGVLYALIVAVAGDIGAVRLPARQTPATERPVHIPGPRPVLRFDTMGNHRTCILEPVSNMRAVLAVVAVVGDGGEPTG